MSGLRTQPLTAAGVPPPRFTKEVELDQRQQAHEAVFLGPARFTGIVRMPDAKTFAAEVRVSMGRRRWAIDKNKGRVRRPIGGEKDAHAARIVVPEFNGDVVAQTSLALDPRDIASQARKIIAGAALQEYPGSILSVPGARSALTEASHRRMNGLSSALRLPPRPRTDLPC